MAEARGGPPRSDGDQETPRYEAPFVSSKDGGLDITLVASVSILLTFLAIIIFYLIKMQRDEAAAKRRTAAYIAMAEQAAEEERREANVAGGRRRNVRNRRANFGDDDGFLNEMLAQNEAEEGMGEEEEGPVLRGENGEKIGKKKAAKLEAKEEKKYRREQELIEREERKKREAEREAEREKEREREKMEEEAEKERERKEREEKEKREEEEYQMLKASFAVQDEGFDQVQGEEEENLIHNFVEHVKQCKVVNIDELAAHFSLRSEEAVDRLNHFLESGLLTGVMDDRGKFIYVTEEEMAAVAKFINQRGRVTIAELAEYSNRLIKLES